METYKEKMELIYHNLTPSERKRISNKAKSEHKNPLELIYVMYMNSHR